MSKKLRSKRRNEEAERAAHRLEDPEVQKELERLLEHAAEEAKKIEESLRIKPWQLSQLIYLPPRYRAAW